jgi:hypothetical protein
VATTHPISAYGGLQLAESAVRQIADEMAAGKIPMQHNHDLSRPSSAVIIATGVEPTEDGHLAAWVEFDIDEDEWELYEQEKREAGAPGGMSFSTLEPFASRGEAPYEVEIAADAAYFDDAMIVSAAEEALPGELRVQLARYYQFSWIPEPKVVVDLAAQVLMSIPGDVLSAYLYDLAVRFKAKLAGKPEKLVFELRVRRTPIFRSTKIKLVADDTDELRQAMQAIPEILRAEGQTAYWDSSEKCWVQLNPKKLDARGNPRPDHDNEPPAQLNSNEDV